jgi:hypothetical protein
MEKFPSKVFESYIDKQMRRMIRPPTKKHLGEAHRASDQLTTTVKVFNKQFSEAQPDLEREEDGTLKPAKTTAIAARYRVKMQKAPDIKAFCRMQERAPGAGMDASLLVLPPRKLLKRGYKAKRVCMAAAPVIARANIPRGKARLERLPTATFKMNVVMMDENADVTFGVKEYEATVREPSQTYRLLSSARPS